MIDFDDHYAFFIRLLYISSRYDIEDVTSFIYSSLIDQFKTACQLQPE